MDFQLQRLITGAHILFFGVVNVFVYFLGQIGVNSVPFCGTSVALFVVNDWMQCVVHQPLNHG